jgi:hypothetical protein
VLDRLLSPVLEFPGTVLDARRPPSLHDFVVGIVFDLIELVCIDFAFDNVGHDERDVRVNTLAMVPR